MTFNPSHDLRLKDCISGMAELPPDSVHLSVTSIPFEQLFVYSGKEEDVGNNGSTIDILKGRFALNMRFVAQQLFRVLAPGCNFCCHIQQLLAYKNQHGFAGRRDFRGATIEVFGAAGFEFKGEVAIPKNPQELANKLNLHSLQFKTGHTRSSTDWAMAPNDYVLVFQKPGDVVHPVKPLIYHVKKWPLSRENWFKANCVDDLGYTNYLQEWAKENKAINPTGWMSRWDWIDWANGCWADIQEVDVLAKGNKLDPLKEHKTEPHPCPLQLEVIRRCVMLYSNPISIQPDVTVLDPFMGIGSTAYVCLGGRSPHTKFCLHEPRNVIGFELKDTYHRASLENAAKAMESVRKAAVPTVSLYDKLAAVEAVA